MRHYIAGTLLLTMLGCSSVGTKLNHLSVGMTKAQVLDTMGDPESTKADGLGETLVYKNGQLSSDTGEYVVILENGKVSKYGRSRDFSTHNGPQPIMLIGK